MSILSQLKLLDTKKILEKDLSGKIVLITDESELKNKFNKLIEDLENDRIGTFFADLKNAEKIDLEILKILRKQRNKDAYDKAKTILKTLHALAEQSEHQNKDEVIDYLAKILDHILIVERIEIKEETDILEQFEELSQSAQITKEHIDRFLDNHPQFFKLKPNKKLKKQIKKVLSEKIQQEQMAPGPIMKNKELNALKVKLDHYFESSEFKNLFKKFVVGEIKVMVGLYGSLVTGFASAESAHRGLPSDYNRVSDVDIGVTIEPDVMKLLPLSGNKIIKHGIYFGPYFEHTAEKMGPFVQIFQHINKLSYAGSTHRKIGIIISDSDFYKHNRASDPQVNLIKKNITL